MQGKKGYNLYLVLLALVSILLLIIFNFGYTYSLFSCILTCSYYLICFINPKLKMPFIFGIVLLLNVLVLLFFHFSINGGVTLQNLALLILHAILPLAVIFDYFKFCTHGSFKIYYPVLWIIAPFAFLASSYILIQNDAINYPYFFMNNKAYGVKPVLYLIFVVFIVHLILGFILVLFDKVLSLNRKKK